MSKNQNSGNDSTVSKTVKVVPLLWLLVIVIGIQ